MKKALFVALLASCAGGAGRTPADVADVLWTEEPAGEPVIDRGPAGAWDHYAVDNPFVFVEDGVFTCFYEGQDKPFPQGGHERAGLATSRDGLHWEKWKGNPVLDVGPAGAWDSRVAKLPVVSRHGDTYYLFYSGRDSQNKRDTENKNIGVATSKDLRTWTKYSGNPVLSGRPDAWDRQLSTYPAAVVQRGAKYHLLYRGMQSYYKKQACGIAVSDDLLHWARASDGPVIPPEEEVASLAVAPMGDVYFGMNQPVPSVPALAPGRACWVSRDLHTWRKCGQARFTGGAVDTCSNPFYSGGAWTVVYEQKDRIYRAVWKGPTP
jgi:predicted GH43/DUF377 family glycosyl hydrolase